MSEIGGDPILGTYFKDVLADFAADEKTKMVVLIGEIGGSAEEEAAALVKELKLPAVAMIAGRTAPPGKTMGHAGAIVSGSAGTAAAKVEAFRGCRSGRTGNDGRLGSGSRKDRG